MRSSASFCFNVRLSRSIEECFLHHPKHRPPALKRLCGSTSQEFLNISVNLNPSEHESSLKWSYEGVCARARGCFCAETNYFSFTCSSWSWWCFRSFSAPNRLWLIKGSACIFTVKLKASFLSRMSHFWSNYGGKIRLSLRQDIKFSVKLPHNENSNSFRFSLKTWSWGVSNLQ